MLISQCVTWKVKLYSEKVARAYDAALYCFCGPEGRSNFPADERRELFYGSAYSLSKHDMKPVLQACFTRSINASPVFSSVTSQVIAGYTSFTRSPGLKCNGKCEQDCIIRCRNIGSTMLKKLVPSQLSLWSAQLFSRLGGNWKMLLLQYVQLIIPIQIRDLYALFIISSLVTA
ncbi:hypothetical protein L1049_026317 [Liquidambar formosana]|uniref:Uncharacterized protein n=1 Tax=Liquidambar formosana TaxID=63359 RepID=A0AAP0R776_LIQFO